MFLAAVFATPFFGWLTDKVGRRALLMSVGAILLPTSFLVLGATDLPLTMVTVMLGISFSLVPAVLWPSVTYLVNERRLGTAYGLLTMIQNLGLTLFNFIAGGLNDWGGGSAANPKGYNPMLWFFGITSLLAFVFVVLLRMRETGPHSHGLEKAKV